MIHSKSMNILVTGGAGYVGSVLVPKLLKRGHRVTVLDIMWFGNQGLKTVKHHPNLKIVKGDIRDKNILKEALKDIDAVIHLAAVSNDPCGNLDPRLTKEINFEASHQLVKLAKKIGIKRFVYASSSSVYGVKSEPQVTEDLPLTPLTIYSKTKVWAEKAILKENSPDFTTVILRPATVCGYSPRMRLDLVVNILASHAIMNRKIIVFGGEQKRPNIHIDDMTDAYIAMLNFPKAKISGEIFNVGFENHPVKKLAKMVKDVVGQDVIIETQPSDDPRSYHISSEKLTRLTGFAPKKTIKDAIKDLKAASAAGKIPDWQNINYYNVKKMKALKLG